MFRNLTPTLIDRAKIESEHILSFVFITSQLYREMRWRKSEKRTNKIVGKFQRKALNEEEIAKFQCCFKNRMEFTTILEFFRSFTAKFLVCWIKGPYK